MLLLFIHVLRYPRRSLVAWATLLLTASLATAVPLVTTGDASGLTATAAVLHGTVIPNEPVSVYFEYELIGSTNAYGNRTEAQEIGGSAAIPVTASLSWLKGSKTYRYRLVAVDHNGTKTEGEGITFTTPPEPPMAETGNPMAGANSGPILKGSVNPNGLPAQVRFLYGPTTLYGSSTVMQNIASNIASDSKIVDISSAEISGLTAGATYHYRIIATTPAGTRQGADVSFVVPVSGGGTGSPTGVPAVTTDGFSAVNTHSAELSGTVNPNHGITVAQFEYGMTDSYGHLTALQNVGDGDTAVAVSLTALELLPGTHYHFRLIASNSLGASLPGADKVFDTAPAAPTVVTGTANVNTTSATVAGTVRARGSDALVFIDYGTSPAFLSNSISAGLEPVTGDVTTVVGATLEGLVQGTTYYYQVRAVNAGGTARGGILTFDVGTPSNPDQVLPGFIVEADRQWSVTVNLSPLEIGGWRFEGEWDWRASGIPASGLTAGKRVVEYRRVPGYLPVPAETVTVPGSIVLERAYATSGVTGSGALTVMLQPADLTGAQWRFSGESAAHWKNSEFTATGLAPGDYLIECKPVAGRTTPPPATASVTAGKTTLATMIYYLAEDPGGTPPAIPPALLTFGTVSTGPYAYVGQIISDAGCGTGFVVRPRVVATAGHVVFDDVTLAATTGLRWYFQRHRGEQNHEPLAQIHEPLAQIPRGYDLLSGYADRRMAEKTPGTSTPESQNLDVAALYFLEDAGRGGYGGYLASDATPNDFVTSSTAMKTLIGYPVDGIIPDNQGKMHATQPAIVGFSHVTGQTYTTARIRSSGGNSGGPLCVQNAGVYYPAAIYLGGSSHMVVRAIDSAVVALFQTAEVVIYPVPVFTLQPVADKAVPYGMQTTLTAVASISLTADTTLRYQWYEGASGDISKPVAGATTPTFTTPAITLDTEYWVRAISDSCGTHADSTATTIRLTSSANAYLSNLTPSQGVLSPLFNAGIYAYTVTVPYSTSISIKPEAQIATSTIVVNGSPVSSGSFSPPIPLADNPIDIHVVVTASAGQTPKDYTITVTRLAAPVATTGEATDVTEFSATLHGSVVPRGTVSAHFEYQAPGTTTIKTTPVQILSGDDALLPVEATVSGLSGNGEYHYRLVVLAGTLDFYGNDMTFSTPYDPPLAATGTPIIDTSNKVTLVGGVNPHGLSTVVYFKYGPTPTGEAFTQYQTIPAGSSVVTVFAELTGLATTHPYYCRVVATSTAGTSQGDEVSFQVMLGGTIVAPSVTTMNAINQPDRSVVFNGQVNPNGKSTSAYFEYGPTMTYGSVTLRQEIGNANGASVVTQSAAGLLPRTLYHYRCVAENSIKTTYGADTTFTTTSLPPLATTGTAEALTSTSAKVHATVRARDASATVGFEYSTDKDFLTGVATVPAVESPVTVDVDTPVSAVLTGLSGGTLYYFRVKATNTGGTAHGLGKPLQADSLLGFRQGFTSAVAPKDYRGQVKVILDQAGGGWRFVGETKWRASGAAGEAVGLTTGDRMIEYQPLAGLIQPPSEMVGVVSSDPPTPVELNRFYYNSAGAGDLEKGTLWIGNLRVLLQPDDAVTNGAQWKLAGDNRTQWINSGEMMPDILPGSYLVECKQDISGFATPTTMKVTVRAGQITTTTITYFKAMAPTNVNLELVSLTDASTRQDLPYAYVGMLRSGTGGTYTGFVVKPQVVATVAQAVFDEATLTATSDLQWLLQRNQDQFEPVPQIPRGSYVLTDYAAQRTADATPGTLSNASLNLNVAALYFSQAAGRGGFSGFLAPATGTSAANEYLISDSYKKTLVGYPLKDIPAVNVGQMHATSLEETNKFFQAFEQLYTNSAIQGVEGMLGGPLCVQYGGGTYYPAGIFVGGDTGRAVRAIDSGVVDLFTRAETSANGGLNDTGGGITHSSFSTIGAPEDPGALKVTIEPAGARAAGAGWRLKPEVSYRSSGAQKNGLNGGNYILQLRTVSGFQEPAEETVFITGGQLREITFTYAEDYTPQELWRLANFGTTSNTGDAADDADPDDDGCPNIHEYAAATDPNASSDNFRILTTVKDESGFTVTAAGKATRTYVLERCTSLGSGTWTEVDSAGPLDSDGTVTLTDDDPPDNCGFYRARVTTP